MSYASLNWDYSSLLLEHRCKTGVNCCSKICSNKNDIFLDPLLEEH